MERNEMPSSALTCVWSNKEFSIWSQLLNIFFVETVYCLFVGVNNLVVLAMLLLLCLQNYLHNICSGCWQLIRLVWNNELTGSLTSSHKIPIKAYGWPGPGQWPDDGCEVAEQTLWRSWQNKNKKSAPALIAPVPLLLAVIFYRTVAWFLARHVFTECWAREWRALVLTLVPGLVQHWALSSEDPADQRCGIN